MPFGNSAYDSLYRRWCCLHENDGMFHAGRVKSCRESVCSAGNFALVPGMFCFNVPACRRLHQLPATLMHVISILPERTLLQSPHSTSKYCLYHGLSIPHSLLIHVLGHIHGVVFIPHTYHLAKPEDIVSATNKRPRSTCPSVDQLQINSYLPQPSKVENIGYFVELSNGPGGLVRYHIGWWRQRWIAPSLVDAPLSSRAVRTSHPKRKSCRRRGLR
jgi:hypothetical protein